MPPDRGRASKACTACRKQKTRCYESPAGRACLRCERLAQSCSLDTHHDTNHNYDVRAETWRRNSNSSRQAGDDDRLSRLERTVNALVRRVDELQPGNNSQRPNPPLSPAEDQQTTQHHAGRTSNVQVAAPLFVLRDVTRETGFRPTDRTATNTPSRGLSDDIISKGIANDQETLTLLALFQDHYGRWVSFNPLTQPALLLEDLRACPLLLSACCLIAVRHTTQDLAARLAPKLFKEAKTLLSTAMLHVPQPIEFFQASLVLSMWSTTIGQVPLSIDSWLLSGFALQQGIASGLFDFEPNSPRVTLKKRELDRLCVWNHLALTHLHYCVGTHRRAVLHRRDIDRCRVILGSDHATNFESRMVAEVHLYWVIYESCSASVDLPRAQAALHGWKEEWGFLLEQSRAQFLQMGFYFAQLLAYDQSLKSRSAAVRESLLSEMVRLSTSIINLAMDTGDDRTRHLTDHIYHMISFAAVTLCRLLHNFEEQLSLSHDLHGLDGLILGLASWLHAIGLPSHIAFTMGNVVAAFHKKLRPDSGPSPSTSYANVDPAIQDDFAQLFPELFGETSFDMMNGNILPEYQPI